jgi:hypothetical protein
MMQFYPEWVKYSSEITLEQGNLFDIMEMPPVSGLTLLNVCGHLSLETRAKAIKMLNISKA